MGSQEFRMGFTKWGAQTNEALDALARQTCFAIAEEVHGTTPVDTGTLKGAWQPSLDKAVDAPSEGAAPSGGGSAQITAVAAGVKAGSRFFMVNHLAYAKRIEFGFVGVDSLGRSYDQKGRYFVTTAVKRWPQIVAKVAASLGMTKKGL